MPPRPESDALGIEERGGDVEVEARMEGEQHAGADTDDKRDHKAGTVHG